MGSYLGPLHSFWAPAVLKALVKGVDSGLGFFGLRVAGLGFRVEGLGLIDIV